MSKTKSFEAALDELENIVDAMEEGEIPLEKMIKSYEDGMKLVNFCNKKLSDMEKRIEVLKVAKDEPTGQTNDDADSWSSFDISSERDISNQNIINEHPDSQPLDSDDLPF
ncbi:exodeoxyribonuclease VII small subunit [Lentisphaerota bacterium WC36G]|nr:exodeoxyribonuclease VII small subunit [Lentisphaerae bacterium WC36]